MRDAARTYYERRTIYGEKLVYFGDGQFYDAWHDASHVRTIQTMVPSTLHIGQPMTVTIQINKADDERVVQEEIVLVGTATGVGDHSIELTINANERGRLAQLLQKAKTGKRGARRPIQAIDADRLLAWQLYWRGENFWSGGEIWPWLPEMKTSFPNPNNVEFNKYINDRARAPLGRRYFVITEGSRLNTMKSLLPTPRGRESFEILDMTSNKFGIGVFEL
jgi:hypothetical protein